MDTFVIIVKYGGLGDHLIVSDLPRIANECGGARRVLISNLSEYRHSDYRRLMWEANPYVDGCCDDDAPYPPPGDIPAGMNLLDHIMMFRGLDDRKRYHEPELFFRPERNDLLINATVYDPHVISNAGDITSSHVEKYVRKNRMFIECMLNPREKCIPVKRYGQLLKTHNLEEYCSVIVSARRFICLTSGGATLAAALAQPAICLYGLGVSQLFHHSRLNRYVDVTGRKLEVFLTRAAQRTERLDRVES